MIHCGSDIPRDPKSLPGEDVSLGAAVRHRC